MWRTLVSNHAYLVTLGEEADLFDLPGGAVREGLAFFPWPHTGPPELELIPEGWAMIHQFDRYWLAVPPEPEARLALLRLFYDSIAPFVGGMIDQPRNAENIDYLLEELQSISGPLRGSVVGDIGPGIGLALPLARARGIELVGLEVSPGMRAISAARGMHVIDAGTQEILGLPPLSGAIAGYVLHLQPDAKLINAVLSRFEDRACLVGNLHRGIGLGYLRETVGRLGARLEVLPTPSRMERHGVYVAIGR